MYWNKCGSHRVRWGKTLQSGEIGLCPWCNLYSHLTLGFPQPTPRLPHLFLFSSPKGDFWWLCFWGTTKSWSLVSRGKFPGQCGCILIFSWLLNIVGSFDKNSQIHCQLQIVFAFVSSYWMLCLLDWAIYNDGRCWFSPAWVLPPHAAHSYKGFLS